MRLSYGAVLLMLVVGLSVNTKLVMAAELLSDPLGNIAIQHSTMLLAMTPIEEHESILPLTFSVDCNCLTMGEMAAMLAGAVVGGAAADFALRSAPFAVIGIVAGAAVASMLYRYGF